jgi:outer membrane protein assembly factor BamB
MNLGTGKTIISNRIGEKIWSGCGWTGQPLLVREDDKLFIIQASFDHNLKKIDALTGKLVWEYKFDDVIKGTGTIWYNEHANNLNEQIVILQGSRRGYNKNLYSGQVPSFRAVSYFSGEELWRMDVKRTRSYSRDVDASALIVDDTAYIGLENSTLVIFDPDPQKASLIENILQPKILSEIKLYNNDDIRNHGGNLVVESSPCLLNNHIYITAGSGHVFGYNLESRQIDWDFYIGSDMDGSPVVTDDHCILVTVEKQYIPGQGGVFKLDPAKADSDAVVWFFPTGDIDFESWQGGVIGSVCINDRTKSINDPYLAAFIGIDGYLYVVDHEKIDTQKGKVEGPGQKKYYDCPKLVYKKYIGPSISTPIIIRKRLIAAGYGGLFLFEFDDDLTFTILDKKTGCTFESTPVAFDKKIIIGSRNGYLYCLGEIEKY